MKSITLLELVCVICVITVLTGIGYCIFEINNLKMRSKVEKGLKDWGEWRNNVTLIINANVQEGKLKLPDRTPPVKKKGD